MPVFFFSTRFLFFFIIFPFLISFVLYQLDSFEPAPLPADSLISSTTSIPPLLNDRFLTGAEFIGVGLLNSPEDIAYHKDSNLIYTGCVDGWVKRVSIHDSANDSVVEDCIVISRKIRLQNQNGVNPNPTQTTVEVRRTISPYDLTAADNPGAVISHPLLKGTNYEEWACGMKTALSSRKKFGFLDGSIKRPEEGSADLEDWWTIQALLVSWLRMTIDPVLRSNISHRDVAQDLWDHLWVNTGGRPLGIAFGIHGEVIVADANKGLLNISDDGKKTELLTDEADGVKFKLTDAVVVGDNGVLYFTDASYKYNIHQFIFDFLEGKPHGRLISFDPITRVTRVLVRDLYFANGITMSPDQTHLVFCETVVRRCSKYYISEDRVEVFIQGLPGYPDNIRYDGDGHYWIAMPSEVTTSWKLSMKYPFLRKLIAMAAKYGVELLFIKNASVLQVDLDGNPIALYHDHPFSHITSGVKIGNHLYCGNLLHSYITRLDLLKYPAQRKL